MSSSRAIAIRYPLFIGAFQAEVAKRQEEIRAIKRQQAPYIACAEAMSRLNLENPSTIKITNVGVYIEVTALEADDWSLLTRIAMAVGGELQRRNLHGDGEPAIQRKSMWRPAIFARWHIGEARVELQINLPAAGTAGIAVKSKTHNWTTEEFMASDRNAVGEPAPISSTAEEIAF